MREMMVKEAEGLYYGWALGHDEVAASLETLLEKLDPGVPPEKAAAWAEITEFLLGQSEHGHVVTGLMDTTDR